MAKTLRFVALFLLFFLQVLAGKASDQNHQYYYDFNNRCKQAYQAMIALRINDANSMLAAEQRENPYNLIPVLIGNYDDCLTLVFNGDPKEYAKRKDNFDKRLDLISKGDENSPWQKYAVGTLYFQRAMVRLRFGENFTAATEFRKSFMALKDNRKRFPDFINNKVLLGLEESIVGTIPDSYKWISNILGMSGDVRKGLAQVVDFLSHKDGNAMLMREEAIFYYCYLKFNLLSDRDAVWKYMDESALDFRNNHLFALMKANFALNDNKAAIAEQVIRNMNQSTAYLDAPVFSYEMACALSVKLDEGCMAYFQKFLNKNAGKFFIKDVYEKMCFAALASGNRNQALLYKNKIKTVGSTSVDADKQAQRFAESDELPNITLLKARLYCDGGYFNQSIEQLKSISNPNQMPVPDKLEYNYRYGRIFTLQHQPLKAVPFFEAAIDAGANRQEHYGARAALELGQIYEDLNQNSKAITYYRKCLSMKNHDYKASLDQKAKAGISRLGGGN